MFISIISEFVWMIESWSLENFKRGRERSKMVWRIGMENDTKVSELRNEMVENQIECSRKICVDDH